MHAVAPLPIGLIVGVVVAVVLIILIIIVIVIIVVVLRRRRKSSDAQASGQPVPHKKDQLPFPVQSSSPVPFDKFRERVDELEKNSNLEYAGQFEVCLGKFFVILPHFCDDNDDDDER